MDDNPATMKINVALTPRGKTIQSTNPDGSPGFSYTTKYSSFGLPVIGSTTPTDTMNEKGLILSVQILNASYYATIVPPEKKLQALSNVDTPLWLISQFATVDEVKANLGKVAIWTRAAYSPIRTSEGFNFFKVDCTQLWDLQKIKEMSLNDLQKSGLSDVTSLLKQP